MNPRPKRARRLRTSSSASSSSSETLRRSRRRKHGNIRTGKEHVTPLFSNSSFRLSPSPQAELPKRASLRPKAPAKSASSNDNTPKRGAKEERTRPLTRSHDTATSCRHADPNIVLSSSSESSTPSSPTSQDSEYKARIRPPSKVIFLHMKHQKYQLRKKMFEKGF
ncbi:hypothetical protein ANCCAN_01947 [Ancylostoma caninum]|uniref:Uncharacterized protein n=1 Tax=Ancylostoma caninum TaxID=29170 RepID=A0A368H8B8_ANCCA|nr:hypothetical protein ANCCAN_01947 [Ancylostoma caninum]